MRALVTGGSGFAGRHLVEHLQACGDDVTVLARGTGTDLLDPEATRAAVAAAAPEAVYHLAAEAHVGRSWSEPAVYLTGNQLMTLHVLEGVRVEAPDAAVLAIASGELYGPPTRLPIDETAPLRPQNPYAVSKAGADLLAGFYADAHGLRVVRPRPFNHAGPGQEPSYAVAAFAEQVARGLRAGEHPVVVRTGNPDTRRDYSDVRDVVRAYRLLALHGEPGATYNVCSGTTASARELVAGLAAVAGVEIDHRIEGGLRRSHEVPEVRGTAERLRAATGWTPAIALQRTLADTLAWWSDRLAHGHG